MLYPGTQVFANAKRNSQATTRSQINEQILLLHSNAVAQPGDTWVKALSLKCAPKPVKRSAEATTSDRRQHDLLVMVNSIARHLQKFASIFNQHASGDLRVSFCEPAFNTDNTVYQTRVSTNAYCLIVRGLCETIEFYVVPCADALDFASHAHRYEPILTLHAIGALGQSRWALEGDRGVLTDSDKISRQAFEQLINKCFEGSMDGGGEADYHAVPCGEWWAPRRDSVTAGTVARIIYSQIDWQ